MPNETEPATAAASSPDGADAASTSAENPAVDAADAGQATEGSAPDAAAAPEVPEGYRAEDGTPDIAKLIERVSAADAAKGDVPATAADYDLSLPEDLELPEGMDLKIDPENEHLKAALDAFHEAGVPQSTLSKVLPAYMQALAGDLTEVRAASEEAVQAEIAKLGADGPARITGLQKSISSALGDDAEATALLDDIRSEAGFKALEKIVSRLNGGDEQPSVTRTEVEADWQTGLYPSMQPQKTAAR